MHGQSQTGHDKNNHALAAFCICPVPRIAIISNRVAYAPDLVLALVVAAVVPAAVAVTDG